METREYRTRVSEYMKGHRMAEEGEGILAAVSGGADSVCLLWILKELSGMHRFRLAAFHLNHGLRGDEAARDEAYVRELCEKLDVPLSVVREDVSGYAKEQGMSVEEAGRELRYQHLAQAAEQFSCSRIATAHHQDDDVETVLMNLFRGSGLKGLGGIRPVRGNVIRPLLCLSRSEIEQYLTERGITWCEDSTNRELVYVRNKIRNVLVPWIKEEVNDRAGSHVLKTSELAAEADEYFAAEAEKILRENMESGDCIKFPTAVLDAQPHIMKTYLVRAMIARMTGSEKDISAAHIEAVCGLTGPGGGTAADMPYGLKAVRGYDVLEIRRREPCGDGSVVPGGGDRTGCNGDLLGRAGRGNFPEIQLETRVFPWEKGLEIPKNQYTKWFDYDKIESALCVRSRESGDYFLYSGEKRKLLKRYFIDEKIPEELRDRIPLLAEGSHVLWVIGYRISEYYKISEDTRTILEVRYAKEKKNV